MLAQEKDGTNIPKKVKGLVRISNSIYSDKITKAYSLDSLAKIPDKKDSKKQLADG